VNGVHDFFHGIDGVFVLQQVLGECGFVISVFKVTKVFLKAGAERSAGLSCVFHVGQVIWYIPELSYLFLLGWCFFVSSFLSVLFVKCVTLILVFLKTVVMALVSLPT
jgi:hypothetical protein